MFASRDPITRLGRIASSGGGLGFADSNKAAVQGRIIRQDVHHLHKVKDLHKVRPYSVQRMASAVHRFLGLAADFPIAKWFDNLFTSLRRAYPCPKHIVARLPWLNCWSW